MLHPPKVALEALVAPEALEKARVRLALVKVKLALVKAKVRPAPARVRLAPVRAKVKVRLAPVRARVKERPAPEKAKERLALEKERLRILILTAVKERQRILILTTEKERLRILILTKVRVRQIQRSWKQLALSSLTGPNHSISIGTAAHASMNSTIATSKLV